jgi:hypothetical protein
MSDNLRTNQKEIPLDIFSGLTIPVRFLSNTNSEEVDMGKKI